MFHPVFAATRQTSRAADQPGGAQPVACWLGGSFLSRRQGVKEIQSASQALTHLPIRSMYGIYAMPTFDPPNHPN